MDEYVHVLSTTQKKEDAARIAKALVDRRLAGCVQVMGPLESTYRWRGKVERAREWLLLIKSTKKAYPRLEKAIKEMHPYETPEILALPVVKGSKEYLRWLSGEVR